MNIKELSEPVRNMFELSRVARAQTVEKAHGVVERTVFGFVYHLESTLAGMSKEERQSLLDRAQSFFQDALNKAAKDIMLACIFTTEEPRAKQGVEDFIVMLACYRALRQKTG